MVQQPFLPISTKNFQVNFGVLSWLLVHLIAYECCINANNSHTIHSIIRFYSWINSKFALLFVSCEMQFAIDIQNCGNDSYKWLLIENWQFLIYSHSFKSIKDGALLVSKAKRPIIWKMKKSSIIGSGILWNHLLFYVSFFWSLTFVFPLYNSRLFAVLWAQKWMHSSIILQYLFCFGEFFLIHFDFSISSERA